MLGIGGVLFPPSKGHIEPGEHKITKFCLFIEFESLPRSEHNFKGVCCDKTSAVIVPSMKDVSLIESIFRSFEFPDPILFPREVIRKTVL